MKDTCQDGNTVITDFEKDGTNNKIELLNFGLDKNSLQELLNNSQDGQNGNAVIKLNGHTITFEGVDISKLRADQFELYNNPSK
ncbi:hypothetical protein COMNV_00381 [Commensalibacter sp. Nvir]|nr:hypothetical protein COMNV_00381 [Commensalibacter sp. Nvir]